MESHPTKQRSFEKEAKKCSTKVKSSIIDNQDSTVGSEIWYKGCLLT